MKVASHMRGAPVLQLPTMDNNSGSEEEANTPVPRNRGLKSVVLFVSGFLMVMAGEKDIKPFMLQHVQELMEDTVIQQGAHPGLPSHIWMQQ